jgi:hypothetical protein
MEVKISGARDGADWPDTGEVLDTSDEEAAQLINSRLATPILDVVETADAVAVDVEQATLPRPSK